MEHSENDATNSLKKAIKQRAVTQKERTKSIVNSKNKVSVCTIDEFKGHFGGTVNAVFVTAGRAKFRMAAERNELQFVAVGTAIHGTAVRGFPTVNHLLNVFHNNRTWMKSIFNFFVVFFKNLLKDVHKSIMKEIRKENKPTPQD